MGSLEDDDQDNCYCKPNVLDNVICISDREEGEIVEANDLEDVSDISSEEEFLLRQRIQILENYNDALERKEAKRRSITIDSSQLPEVISISLSDISASDSEVKIKKKVIHNEKNKNNSSKKVPAQRKVIRRRDRSRNVRKDRHKVSHQTNYADKKCIRKKIKTTRSISESSAEYENKKYEKRRKLREAICIPKNKNDSSLKLRLLSMLDKGTNKQDDKSNESYETITPTVENKVHLEAKSADVDAVIVQHVTTTPNLPDESKENSSDDDIEALRQLALQTKFKQNKESIQIAISKAPEDVCNNVIDDMDSDTAELRLYALKTAILKKAIERKKRIKSIAKLKSKSSFVTRSSLGSEFETIEEDFVKNLENQRIEDKNNSTDVESVDMDIDNPSNDESTKIDTNLIEVFDNSDSKEMDKYKMIFGGNVYDELSFGQNDHKLYQYNVYANLENSFIVPSVRNEKMDEDIEEDEDILRAKLLTSLSNNIKISNAKKENPTNAPPIHVPPLVPSPPPIANLVIKLGDSDSGTDCESTRNLTEMHKRLTDQSEFQKNLDLFLKSARKAAESKTAVKNQSAANIVTAHKYSPMAVKHLPRADQQEYKRLVMRMAELEKVKQARQIALYKTSNGNNSIQIKITQGTAPHHQNQNPKWGYNGTLLNQIVQDNTNTNTSSNLDGHIDHSRELLSKATDNVLNLRQEVAQQLQVVKMAARQFRISKKDLLVKQQALTLAKNTLITRQFVHHSLLKRSMIQTMNNIPKQMKHKNITIDNKSSTSSKTLKKQLVVNKPSAQQTNTLIKNVSNSMRVEVTNDSSKATDSTISTTSKVINNQAVVGGKLSAQQTNTPKRNVSNSIRAEVIKDLSKSLILNDSKKHIDDDRATQVQAVSKDISLKNNRSQLDAVGNDNIESDYQSPLQYKITNSWSDMDPNGVLCPFMVSGACKDSDCAYLHPKL